jgi:serine/threonine-protein kinase
VRPYRTGNVPLRQIATDLEVGTLVQGSIAQSGDLLRVNVSLVDAKTGIDIGGKTLERPRAEIFALQDDLAQEVSIFLRQRLGQAIELRKTQVGTKDAEAWELVQRAEQLTNEVDPLLAAADTAAAARRLTGADSLLSQAEARDSKWISPIVKRGWLAYRQLDLIGTFDKTYYGNWLDSGMGHANRALALNPTDPDAFELRGTLQYWRWLLNLEPEQAKAAKLLADAEGDLRAAVQGNPHAAFAWTLLSHLLMGQSQTGEAKLAALNAYEADPYLTSAKQTVWRLFQSSLDLEDRTEATHWCAEGRRRFPEYFRFTECQIWLFALKGVPPDIPKAWTLLDEFVSLSPPNQRASQQLYGQMLVALALARAGLKDSARAVAERSRGDAEIDPTRDQALVESLVRIVLEDKDEALRLLSTYLATNPQFRASLARDQTWWFQSIRDDPRFKALVGTGG